MKSVFFAILFSIGAAAHARPVPVNPDITSNDPLPVRVFDCGGSIITSITDRFGGVIGEDENLGSRVSFSNHGGSVSYSLVEEIQKSRVGDHVMVCLVYIPDPDKCPPGDDRGRVYTVTNLRTLESWTLSPDQHMCGGA